MEGANVAIIDRILELFTILADAGVANIKPEVMWMFFMIGSIAMTWQHLKNLHENKAHPVGLLFGQLMTIGFFVWLFNNYTMLTTAYYLGMIKLGLLAGGLDGVDPKSFGHPSSLMKIGFEVAKPLLDAMGLKGWFTGTNFLFGLSVLMVLAAYFIMTWQVFIAILEFKLGLIWTFFMMAFAMLKQTNFATEKALGYIFASGLKLFGLATITSIGAASIKSLLMVSANPTYGQAISVALGSMTVGLLTWYLPAKIAGVAAGGPNLGAGSALSMAAAYGSLAGAAIGAGGKAAEGLAKGSEMVANAANRSGFTSAVSEAASKGKSNLANSPAGRAAIAVGTMMAANAQGAASAAIGNGPVGNAIRAGAGFASEKAGAFGKAVGAEIAQGFRGGASALDNSPAATKAANDGGGITPEMKANPVAAADAMERMSRIERRADSAKASNGGTSAGIEHSRAQAYRGLAWDIGSSVQGTNPALFSKIESELGRIDGAGQAMAKNGVDPATNSATQAQEYKNLATRALNLDGGGGFDKPQVTGTMSPEGQKQNAAALAAIGVGSDIRSMAAKGMSNRDIASSLGDKLNPISAQASRLGLDGSETKLNAISDFKAVNGIPNKGDAGFSQWAKSEKASNPPAQRTRPPQWAQQSGSSWRPPNIRSFIPQGTERSGGMNASGSTPDL